MIHTKDIKNILDRIPTGTTLSVKEIQNFVKSNFDLGPKDWGPYTQTRQTNYSRWKHIVQAVLEKYKKTQKVTHNSLTHFYTFNES